MRTVAMRAGIANEHAGVYMSVGFTRLTRCQRVSCVANKHLRSGRWLSLVAALATLGGCPSPQPSDPDGPVTRVALELVSDGLTSPTALAAPADGTGRLFVLEQPGRVRVIDKEVGLLAEPLLDVSNRMPTIGIDFGGGILFDERGLLGIALHPRFVDNNRFYLFYSVPLRESDPANFNARIRVAEYLVAASDPNRADLSFERILLEVPQPQFNHNGGQIAFGPDGFLYIGLGDGGGSNDEGLGHNPDIGNGQDLSTPLGKILRIDVDRSDTARGLPYAIPVSNPFVNTPGAAPEIFALGFRNPWRFSFAPDGRLFVADVGQDLREEISIVTAGGNYGWRLREGTLCFDPASPSAPPANCATTDAAGQPLIEPIIDYPHSAARQPFGLSVTGGYVARSGALPRLRGEYIFADWSTNFVLADGTLFAARENADGSWSQRELVIDGLLTGRLGRFILSLGEDAEGNLYLLTSENVGPVGSSGAVFRIAAER